MVFELHHSNLTPMFLKSQLVHFLYKKTLNNYNSDLHMEILWYLDTSSSVLYDCLLHGVVYIYIYLTVYGTTIYMQVIVRGTVGYPAQLQIVASQDLCNPAKLH